MKGFLTASSIILVTGLVAATLIYGLYSPSHETGYVPTYKPASTWYVGS